MPPKAQADRAWRRVSGCARRAILSGALLLWFWLGQVAPPAALAALPRPADGQVSVRSRSEQFIVQGPREILASPGFLSDPRHTNFVRLDQPRLAVMCERIKQALLTELDLPDRAKGRIFINLRVARGLGEPPLVRAQHTPGGWFYVVELPSEIEPPRLVRIVVAVLLQEMADRNAGTRPPELPPWLVPGMAAQIESRTRQSLIVEDLTSTVRVERHIDPLAPLRQRLDGRMPLTLDELNWPTDAQLAEPPGEYYEHCAHLFLHQLLKLPEGPKCLGDMLIREAPKHLNWQMAFLKAFAPHFKSLRDADKWWSLQLASWSGRDQSHTYNLKESWQKLEEILQTPVKIHADTNTLPERTTVSLQAIVGQWSYARQKPVLRQKVAQLQILRLRIAPALVELTDEYRLVLAEHLGRRDRAGFTPDTRMFAAESPRLLTRRTLERLAQLDQARGELKTQTTAENQPRADLPREE